MPLIDYRKPTAGAGTVASINGELPDISGNITLSPGDIGATSIEYYGYVLQPADITAKQITLPSTPDDPLKVMMDVIEGIGQDNGVDFQVVGTILSWSGMGFETLAEVGDELLIEYQKQ